MISVVLPAKNEAARVGGVVAAIKALSSDAQIIVVNDGSTDSTAYVAREAGAEVLTLIYSRGNGAAIKPGARAASGNVIVFMEAEGQHNPVDIHDLLAELERGYDLVVGTLQAGSQASLGRGLANGFYNKLASYMAGHRVEDLTSGFRAVRAEKNQRVPIFSVEWVFLPDYEYHGILSRRLFRKVYVHTRGAAGR